MIYEVVSPQDGRPVGYKLIKDRNSAENPALVFDIVPDGSVWDASSGKPRLLNVAEILAAAKEAKRSELARAFVAANTTLYPEVESEYAIWLAVPEYVASPSGTRPTVVRNNILRFQDRLSKVSAATTVAEVEAVTW